MEPILIDMNEYVRTGEGANGASYDHKTDPSIMMKMYFRNFEAAALELELAQKVYGMGIPTPEPGDLVTDGERIGIRFKRMPGKRSYSRACGDEPERVEEYAREFARMCKHLHSIHVDTTQFENVKDRLYAMLDANPFFTDEQKSKIHDFIAAAPDADTAIHGDSSSAMRSSRRKMVSVRPISSTSAISVTVIRCSTSAWCTSVAA